MGLPQFELTGRTAIVTGGGLGIGKGACLALAQAGANIVVAEKNPDTAEATAREVRALGREALAVVTDMRKREQIDEMIRKTMQVFGKIDILVNNAGGIGREHFASALEMSESVWDDVVELNLKTVFMCSQAVAKVMIEEKKGCIINIASVAAFTGFPLCVPYGASKAAVANLTKSFAEILGPYNIRVNAVAPGSIDTEGRVAVIEGRSQLAEIRQEDVPLGRLGTTEDVANGVVFLASDSSAYISGQVLRIDGAMLK